ncbi:MAG: ABC transporter permease, partial [Frankia sp.]|nr:ABC transporter permease [Frankia sp.]
MASAAGGNCLTRNEWICWRYVETRSDEILAALREHVDLTLTSVALGVAVAVPLVLVARRWRPAVGLIGGATSILYTIPSLAVFALLLPWTGLSTTTVRTGLVLYTLVILFRGFLTALDGVPAEVRESARGLGYGPARLLLTVEIPLALPAIIGALRVATVSTVALATVGATIGHGGLGNLIYSGLGSTFKAQVLTASLLCLALAAVADLLLVVVERLATPWRRRRGAASAAAGRRRGRGPGRGG